MSHFNLKEMLDVGSLGVAISTIFGWLPSVAALLTIVWYLIRLYEWYKGKDVEH